MFGYSYFQEVSLLKNVGIFRHFLFSQIVNVFLSDTEVVCSHLFFWIDFENKIGVRKADSEDS